jgi:hypothetical protein
MPMVTSAASTPAAPIPALAWSPSGAFDYGVLDAALGQRASQTFALSDANGKSGRISIVLTGSPTFTKSVDGCSGKRLNKPCTVTVIYAPTTNGATSASLTATGTSGATATVSLRGASAWQPGDLHTWTQSNWHIPTVGGEFLMRSYSTVYASNAGLFDIGRVSSSSFSASWTSPSALLAFLPASGAAGPLTSDLLNPTSSSAGSFAGNAVALKLNVDFSDAGLFPAHSPRTFGDVTVCGLTSATDLNGQTVRQVLDRVNTAISGGSTNISIADLDDVSRELSASFVNGMPGAWAQQHLVPGACP